MPCIRVGLNEWILVNKANHNIIKGAHQLMVNRHEIIYLAQQKNLKDTGKISKNFSRSIALKTDLNYLPPSHLQHKDSLPSASLK